MDLDLAPFARLLPFAGEVGVRRRRAAATATPILLLSLAAHVIYAVIGEGASQLADVLVNQVARQLTMISAALLCALSVRRGDPDGGAWLALAIGLGLWVAGNSYWSLFLAEAENPPIPSPADAGRLAFYPFACLCLGLHTRRAVRGIPGSMWLDGLVGVLAVAAIGIAFMVGPILATTRGSTVELVVDAVYPIGDILLLALVAAFLGLAGAGRGRAWTLLGAGFALFAAADTAYLYLLAGGVSNGGPGLKSLWLAGMALMAIAAWQPTAPARARRQADWRIHTLPFAACTASIGAAAVIRSALASARRRLLRRRGARGRDGPHLGQRPRAAPAGRDAPPGEHRRADGPAEPALIRP